MSEGEENMSAPTLGQGLGAKIAQRLGGEETAATEEGAESGVMEQVASLSPEQTKTALEKALMQLGDDAAMGIIQSVQGEAGPEAGMEEGLGI